MGTTGEVPSGLAGVVVAQTRIGDVRGDEGYYHYRGHDATELARRRSLEAVWHLVQRGTLPGAGDEAAFRTTLARDRRLPAEVVPALRAVALAGRDGDPQAPLRAGLAAVSSHLGLRSWLDLDAARVADDIARLTALVPTIAATMWRLARGLDAVPARDDLGAAAHYRWQLTGEEPDAFRTRALERYLVATIDHGFNSSTFAARVAASTGADVGAALLAGLAALSGPLHGGAPSRALEMLAEIGTPDRAEAWVVAALGRGERIMGFGHRVYRTEDPRAALLRDVSRELGGPLADLALAVETTVLEQLAQRSPTRPLRTNVEYYAAVVLDQVGLPAELFGPTFATSRAIGWGAHVLEQIGEGRIIRPLSRYVGALSGS